MTPRLLRLAVATLVVAAAGLTVVGAWPAQAATCTSPGGVSVVVDFRELGGGAPTTCDASGGSRTASSLFEGSGFPLTYAQRQPGFVCRVSGAPASDPCVNTAPANAYWGLYWSNGTSGTWAYSTLGAGSLRIPAGGSVAFAWQGAGTGPPGAAPPVFGGSPAPSASPSPTKSASPSPSPTKSAPPSPTKSPSPTPTKSPIPSSTAVASSASPTRTPTVATPTTSSSAAPTEAPTKAPTKAPNSGSTGSSTRSTATPSGTTVAEPADPGEGAGSGAVPLPLVVVVLALLGALASGAAVVRRRRATSGDVHLP